MLFDLIEKRMQKMHGLSEDHKNKILMKKNMEGLELQFLDYEIPFGHKKLIISIRNYYQVTDKYCSPTKDKRFWTKFTRFTTWQNKD